MPIEITMPALSPTMTEGNLVKWVKKEGDKIKSGDIIAEIETDKATMELEASNSGTLGKIIMPEGSEAVKVNTLIALLLKDGEDKSVLNGYKPKEAVEQKAKEEVKTASAPAPAKQELLQEKQPEKIFASPLAKRIAAEQGIELSKIEGTGPHGRIVRADLENIPAVKQPAQQVKIATPFMGRNEELYRLEALPNIRKVIAKRLLESKQTVPHFYLSLSVNMDEAMEFRMKANKGLDAQGIKLSVNDLIIKASALALRDFPAVNASFLESGMAFYNNVDVSVAVSTESGLITPIVKNADAKTLSTISIEMKELAKKARENKLKPEEFQGGGFSISNLGMYSIENFAAIINPPQSAILAVGATFKKPHYSEALKAFVPVNSMGLTLSADHRVVDGALGAEFLNKIKFYLENPILLSI